VAEIFERFGPIARELLAAWLRLPREGVVPDRDSFDPMAIRRILPVISLIERKGEETWCYRLVGSEIERRWGRRITGMDVIQGVSPEAAAMIREELRTVVEWPCGSWSQRRISLRSGRVAAVQTVRLPLRVKDGTVSQILSCSGELSGDGSAAADPTREIVRIVEHQFFDIGAGLPTQSTLVPRVR